MSDFSTEPEAPWQFEVPLRKRGRNRPLFQVVSQFEFPPWVECSPAAFSWERQNGDIRSQAGL